MSFIVHNFDYPKTINNENTIRYHTTIVKIKKIKNSKFRKYQNLI